MPGLPASKLFAKFIHLVAFHRSDQTSAHIKIVCRSEMYVYMFCPSHHTHKSTKQTHLNFIFVSLSMCMSVKCVLFPEFHMIDDRNIFRSKPASQCNIDIEYYFTCNRFSKKRKINEFESSSPSFVFAFNTSTKKICQMHHSIGFVCSFSMVFLKIKISTYDLW